MKNYNDEIRSYGGNAQPTFVEGRTITGYAIVFNQPSEVIYDPKAKKVFREIIRPEAVTDKFVRTQDVKLNRNHDDDILLARSRNGEGTLKLEVDEIGLKYTAEMPNTTAGNDTLELVRRGDLFGSSFRFIYGKGGVRSSKMDSEDMILREVTKLGGLYDVSVVADPAYMATTVSCRSLEAELETPTEPEPEPAQVEPVAEPQPEPTPAEPETERSAESMTAEELAYIDAELAALDNFKF